MTVSEQPIPRRSKALSGWFAVKLCVGIVLLVIVCVLQGVPALGALREFRYEYLIPLTIVTMILLWVSCLKWELFLKARGHRIHMSRLISLYWIGRFFDNFLPSTIGSDATRTVLLGRQIGCSSKALVSILLERFTGVVTLLVLATVCAVWSSLIFEESIIAIVLAVFFLACLVFLIVIVSVKKSAMLLASVAGRSGVKRVSDKLLILHDEIGSFRREYGTLAGSFAYSLLFYILAGVKMYTVCLCVVGPVPFWPVLMVAPMVLIFTAIPVSVGNLGWAEWTYTVLLPMAPELNLSPAEGLAIALTLRAYNLLFSVVGGVLFVTARQGVQPAA